MLDYDIIKDRIEELKKIRNERPVETQIMINEALLETFFNPRLLAQHRLRHEWSNHNLAERAHPLLQ